MTCSQTPGIPNHIPHVSHGLMLPSITKKMSAIPKRIITGLNHFDLSVYGLPFPLSTS